MVGVNSYLYLERKGAGHIYCLRGWSRADDVCRDIILKPNLNATRHKISMNGNTNPEFVSLFIHEDASIGSFVFVCGRPKWPTPAPQATEVNVHHVTAHGYNIRRYSGSYFNKQPV